RLFQYVEDMLELKDIDAVVISTADFQHATHLTMAAEAGKDAYCEKPMANVLEEAKAARDAVRTRKLVVQVGTQHRSEPYQAAARQHVVSGELGQISKVEIVWNYHGPRWRGRPEVKQIREAETDWRRWLLTKPYRPFDPQQYFEFRLYRDFSSGIPDQWMTHAVDMVHFCSTSRSRRRRSPMAGWTAGAAEAKTQTPSRRCSDIRRGSCSAAPPVSATIPTASVASWAIALR